VLTSDDAGRRADDRKRHKLGRSPEPRPQSSAQEARLAGARSGLDYEEAWAAAMSDLAQLADAGHDVGLAAEEDAGRILVKGIEAGIGQRLRIMARRPREGVGRNAPVDQLGMDGRG
jgi:hypothetical protein